jgi:hypothetical protein
VTVKHCALQELLGLSHEVSAFIATNSADIIKTGAKYLSDELVKTVGSKTKSKLGSATVDGLSQSMATLYAQAAALDLFPHLLLCLEAVYSSSAHKIVERVRNFKLKYSIGHNVSKAVHLSSPVCLVSSAVQGSELLGKVLFARLNESCWHLLQTADLLPILSEVQIRPNFAGSAHSIIRVDSPEAPILKRELNTTGIDVELETETPVFDKENV